MGEVETPVSCKIDPIDFETGRKALPNRGRDKGRGSGNNCQEVWKRVGSAKWSKVGRTAFSPTLKEEDGKRRQFKNYFLTTVRECLGCAALPRDYDNVDYSPICCCWLFPPPKWVENTKDAFSGEKKTGLRRTET